MKKLVTFIVHETWWMREWKVDGKSWSHALCNTLN